MERRMRPVLWCVVLATAALGALAPSAHARQSGGSAPSTPAPDYYHWSVSGPMQSQVNFGRVPVKRDVVIFYEQSFGLYPRIWIDKKTGHTVPQNGLVPQRTNWPGHLAKLKLDIAKEIPDPNWDGYACLDFEGWEPVWAILLNEPMKEESRRLVRVAHPTWTPQQVEAQAAVEFEAAGFDFLIRTINACKAERPKAKWGFFGYPYPHQEPYRAKYQPMFDACTGFYPCIYPWNVSVPEGSTVGRGQAPISSYRKVASDIMNLSRRIAGNRSVIAYIWMVYHPYNPNPAYRLLPLNDLDLNAMLRVPKECLADGVAFWDDMQTPAQLRMYNDFFSKHQSDVMMQVLADLFPAGATSTPNGATPPAADGAPTDPGATTPNSVDPNAPPPADGTGAATGDGTTTDANKTAADEKAAKKVKTKTKKAKAPKKAKKSGVLTKGKALPAPKKINEQPSDPNSDAVLRK